MTTGSLVTGVSPFTGEGLLLLDDDEDFVSSSLCLLSLPSFAREGSIVGDKWSDPFVDNPEDPAAFLICSIRASGEIPREVA
jgi:hypothetical protein